MNRYLTAAVIYGFMAAIAVGAGWYCGRTLTERRPGQFGLMCCVMGFVAGVISLAANYGLYLWEVSLLQSSLAFTRLVPTLTFLGAFGSCAFLVAGTGVGAIGAYATVRQINDGWSASQRHES